MLYDVNNGNNGGQSTPILTNSTRNAVLILRGLSLNDKKLNEQLSVD